MRIAAGNACVFVSPCMIFLSEIVHYILKFANCRFICVQAEIQR